MAQFDICITQKGRELLAASVGGSPLTFQNMVLGDGGYGGDLSKVEEVISSKLTLEINSVQRYENQVSIQSVITAGTEVTPFYWREVGIYAQDPASGKSVLAVYGNAGEKSDYLSGAGGILDEKIINITVLVEPDEVVTDLSGVLFATQKEFLAHTGDASMHQQILSYSKAGTTHQLTGLSGVSGTVSAVFTASDVYSAGDTFTIDGTPYTIQLTNGEAAEDNLFVSGATVSVILDTVGKKINFKAGGGLTNSMLALATATEADVSSGKTFYAGNKILKTGTAGRYVYGQIDRQNQTVSCGFKPKTIILWTGAAYYDNNNRGIGGWIHVQNGNINTQSYLGVSESDDNGGYYGPFKWVTAITSTGFQITSRGSGDFGDGSYTNNWYYVAME